MSIAEHLAILCEEGSIFVGNADETESQLNRCIPVPKALTHILVFNSVESIRVQRNYGRD
jgi:hypothetical protein